MTIANDDADTTQTPRADAWRGVFLCAALICCPVVYSFRLTSFLLAKEAVLWVCLCFCAASSMVRGRFSWGGYRAFLPLWVLVVVSGLFHLVLFPAKVPADVVTEITRWCALLVAAAFLCDLLRQRVWRRRLVNAWLFSAVLAAGLGLLQFANAISFLFPTFPGYTQRAYSVFGNQDLLGGYSAMAIPLCANRVLRRRPGPRCALLAMAILTPALLLSGSRSAWLAAVLGLIVAVPYRNLRFRPTALLCSVTIALVAATALLVPDATTSRIRNTAAEQDEGGRIRLWIWNGTLRMVRDVPWFGIGPGNYPYWSPRYLGEALRAPGGEQHRHNELHVRNAHSEPLEIFAETGVIGFVFCLWMLLRLIRCRGPECGGLAALLTFALFNAPFHSAPHALGGLLFAGILLYRRQLDVARAPTKGERRMGTIAAFLRAMSKAGTAAVGPTMLKKTVTVPIFIFVFVVVFGLSGLLFWSVLWPSYCLRAAQEAHLAGLPSLPLYERVVRHPWPNALAHAKYGVALDEAGLRAAARREFERARAGLDTGEIHLALGVLAFEEGDLPTARQRLEDCVARWPSNAFAWDLLLRCVPAVERPGVVLRAQRWVAAAELDAPSASGNG